MRPASLNFEREPRPDVSLEREKEGVVDMPEAYREKWIERMEWLRELQDLVTLHLEVAYVKQTRYCNKSRRDFCYEVGD